MEHSIFPTAQMLIGICVQVWLVRVRFGLAVRASLIIFDGFHVVYCFSSNFFPSNSVSYTST